MVTTTIQFVSTHFFKIKTELLKRPCDTCQNVCSKFQIFIKAYLGFPEILKLLLNSQRKISQIKLHQK